MDGEKMSSCKGQINQAFCNDPNCGNRDSQGFHWPAGHPMNKTDPQATCECACHRMSNPYRGCDCDCVKSDSAAKAREIARLYYANNSEYDETLLIRLIAAALEAERQAKQSDLDEAFARGIQAGWKDRDNGYAEGRRRRLEEAISLVPDHNIKEEIRRLGGGEIMFTDDDLKRLKWSLENSAPNWVDKDNFLGLLARLEAADELVKELRTFEIPEDARAFDKKHFWRIAEKLQAYGKARGQ